MLSRRREVKRGSQGRRQRRDSWPNPRHQDGFDADEGVAERNRCSKTLQQNNTGERGLVRASKPQLAFAFGSRCFRPVGRVPSLFRRISSRSVAACSVPSGPDMPGTESTPAQADRQSHLFRLPTPREFCLFSVPAPAARVGLPGSWRHCLCFQQKRRFLSANGVPRGKSQRREREDTEIIKASPLSSLSLTTY